MPEMKEIISSRRKERNMTQEQLAEKIGVSAKVVSKWETGRSLPDTSFLLPLCDALGLTVTARVETRPGEGGVPVPWSAEVTGPRSEALAAYMEQELGIPRGRQVWHEVET